MLAAIQFDVQFRLFTKEVQIVITQGMLAAEFIAAEAPVTQPTPHAYFGPGFRLAKLTGAFDCGHEAMVNGRPEN